MRVNAELKLMNLLLSGACHVVQPIGPLVHQYRLHVKARSSAWMNDKRHMIGTIGRPFYRPWRSVLFAVCIKCY